MKKNTDSKLSEAILLKHGSCISVLVFHLALQKKGVFCVYSSLIIWFSIPLERCTRHPHACSGWGHVPPWTSCNYQKEHRGIPTTSANPPAEERKRHDQENSRNLFFFLAFEVFCNLTEEFLKYDKLNWNVPELFRNFVDC